VRSVPYKRQLPASGKRPLLFENQRGKRVATAACGGNTSESAWILGPLLDRAATRLQSGRRTIRFAFQRRSELHGHPKSNWNNFIPREFSRLRKVGDTWTQLRLLER
jgi:hypothetical protein